jgi:hypothetical protein
MSLRQKDIESKNHQSLLLRKLPQKVNPRSAAFIAQDTLFEPQNSHFWNLICCLLVIRPFGGRIFQTGNFLKKDYQLNRTDAQSIDDNQGGLHGEYN